MTPEPSGSVSRPISRAEAVALVVVAWRPTAVEHPDLLLSMVATGSLQELMWESLRHHVLRRGSRVDVENATQVCLAAREFDVGWDDVLPALLAGRSANGTGASAEAPSSRPGLRLIKGGAGPSRPAG